MKWLNKEFIEDLMIKDFTENKFDWEIVKDSFVEIEEYEWWIFLSTSLVNIWQEFETNWHKFNHYFLITIIELKWNKENLELSFHYWSSIWDFVFNSDIDAQLFYFRIIDSITQKEKSLSEKHTFELIEQQRKQWILKNEEFKQLLIDSLNAKIQDESKNK